MCGGRSSILHYWPLIEFVCPDTGWAKSECVAKQNLEPHKEDVDETLSHKNNGLQKNKKRMFKVIAV